VGWQRWVAEGEGPTLRGVEPAGPQLGSHGVSTEREKKASKNAVREGRAGW